MSEVPEYGFSPSEFADRTDRAQVLMAEQELAGLLLMREPEVRYFSGFHTLFWQSPTRPWFLFVPATGKPIAVIPEGISREGVRLVSFSQVLKHGLLPLPEIFSFLLDHCSQGTSGPIEIEFAGNLGSEDQRAELGFLQLRPLALSTESEEVEIGDVRERDLICRSRKVLGNGRITDLRDVIVVDYDRFDRHKSVEVAGVVGSMNAALRKLGRSYLLVGVGRWGSTDPFLGIPVGWNQIAGARVVVEAGFRDLRVTPSQGTHFFQNLTSCNVGYFTVNPDVGDGLLDWQWLREREAMAEDGPVRHIHLDEPLEIKMSGHTAEGVILKPRSMRS